MTRSAAYLLLILSFLSSCSNICEVSRCTSCHYAELFDICSVDSTGTGSVVVISPFDGGRDTIDCSVPLRKIVCMSSSHVACLAAIGAREAVCGVSGLRYLSDSLVAQWAMDVGYDNSLDYEAILSMKPEMVFAYTVSGALPSYISKLRSLNVPVTVLYDHYESHPLARAEYIRLFGALTGHMNHADSVYAAIRARYETLASEHNANAETKKVLINIPYSDAWYIPSSDNYMSQLVRDAGGEILGSQNGHMSRMISMEDAYQLSQYADVWLNPGYCRTRKQLSEIHQLFPAFGPLKSSLPIYNNTLRMTPEGGNDFYESGAVRPDLILEDLVRIFRGSSCSDSLHYHIPLL